MGLDRKTIRKYRDEAHRKIAEKLINGECKMFNNFDLSDQEILKIIEDYKNLINKNSVVSGSFDEDLQQEIKLLIFKVLSKK